MFVLIKDNVRELHGMVRNCKRDFNGLQTELRDGLNNSDINYRQSASILAEHSKLISELQIETSTKLNDANLTFQGHNEAQQIELVSMNARIAELEAEKSNTASTSLRYRRDLDILKSQILESKQEMSQMVAVIMLLKDSISALRK